MTIAAADFNFVSELIRKEAAIVLETGKEYLVESRLNPIIRSEGLSSLTELVNKLKQNNIPGLLRKVVEAMTTNETSFFRDVEPFDVLKNVVIPQLIKNCQTTKELTIWCGAASTGQEPYSLSMLLLDAFPELATWKVKLIATDINQQVLTKAKEGVYTQLEVNRGLPMPYLVKYFEKRGTEWFIKDKVKNIIEFTEMNLIQSWPKLTKVDLVMLRNVLIYFDIPIKRQILSNIRKVMKPESVLFLGAAETTLNVDEEFERKSVGRTSYYNIKRK
jgi:chemotaxis protein methyltransferase CheR